MKPVESAKRKSLAKDVLVGAPVAGLAWLLLIRLFAGEWSFAFPLLIVGFSAVLALFMAGPEPAGSAAYRFWRGLVFLIDWVVTRVVCLSLYYLLITPVGMVLKLFRVSLLQMKHLPGRRSHWQKVSPSPSPRKQYFRQY